LNRRRNNAGTPALPAKLAVPIETRLSASNEAILTLNPTFYLHKFGFGGGNLQLHWPL